MRKKKKISTSQMSLFDKLASKKGKSSELIPGGMDFDDVLRALVSEALKKCSLSRYMVAARMSELTGHEITKMMLDSWTAESKENHRFPAIFIPTFCKVVNNYDVLTFLCEKAGTFNMTGQMAIRAEIQQIAEGIAKQKAEKEKREAFLKEMES